MSDAFICKDQHYEIISKIENEISFTTQMVTATIPSGQSVGDTNASQWWIECGGPIQYLIIESVTCPNSSYIKGNYEIDYKYTGTVSLNLGRCNSYGYTGSATQNGLYTNSGFGLSYTADATRIMIWANVYGQVANGGYATSNINVYSTTITVLLKYKLQS